MNNKQVDINRQRFSHWYWTIAGVVPVQWVTAYWASYEDGGCPAGLTGDHECSHRYLPASI